VKRLVVNADDFGRTSGINQGIVRAHERGIVTSASLMVRWPAAAEAAEYGRDHPALSLGLHLDFGEWTFLDGQWAPVYEVEPTPADVHRQLDEFRRLTGVDPSHLDSHQHVHRTEPARSALLELGRELGVPVRHFSLVRFEGSFYGRGSTGEPVPGAISVRRLLEILRSLPAGATELACHPGHVDGLDSDYLAEREREIEVLCDPRIREALTASGIELCSFRDVFT
jgi:predicted glycoside hydrolase/deacetylase ChbG (UPF0249 family)